METSRITFSDPVKPPRQVNLDSPPGPSRPPVTDQLARGGQEPTFWELLKGTFWEVWNWLSNLFCCRAGKKQESAPPSQKAQEVVEKRAEGPVKPRPKLEKDCPESCAICTEEPISIPMELGDCGHVFGQECILELQTNKNAACPVCRTPIAQEPKLRSDLQSTDLLDVSVQGIRKTKEAPPAVTLKIPPKMEVEALKKVAYRLLYPEAKETSGHYIENFYLLKHKEKHAIFDKWDIFLGDQPLKKNQPHAFQLFVKTNGRGTLVESCDACFKKNVWKNCKHVVRA